MSIETASVRAGARTRDAPPQLKQPFAQAFHAARAAGAEPEWRPAAQPSEHMAYFVGKAGAQGPVGRQIEKQFCGWGRGQWL